MQYNDSIEDVSEEDSKKTHKVSKLVEVCGFIAFFALAGVLLLGLLAGMNSPSASSEPDNSPTIAVSSASSDPISQKTDSPSGVATPAESMEILREEMKEKERIERQAKEDRYNISALIIILVPLFCLGVLFFLGIATGPDINAFQKERKSYTDDPLEETKIHYETLKEEAEYYKRKFKESQKKAGAQESDKPKIAKMSRRQLREYYRSQWDKILVMHDGVINEWLEWTKDDIDKIIDYPSLQDSSLSFVRELVDSLQNASILRPEGKVMEVMDVTGSSYAKAVKELHSAWVKAKGEAVKVGRSELPLSVQKDLGVVENLLARIQHVNTPVPEKVQAAKQIQKLLNGVVDLGQKPMNMLKTVERLELTQGKPHD